VGLVTRDLKPRIGSEVTIDAETLLSGRYLPEIRKLFDERGVVVFPGIGLTDEQQVEFSQMLGDLEQDIFKVTFDETHNPEFAKILYGTWSWHIDRIDLDVPTLGSVLSPRALAPEGGDTEFANTYAAWDDLPESRKAELDGLQVIHTIGASYREVEDPHPGLAEFAEQFEPKVQPLVWRHRTGRKSLAIGIHACGVVGMAQEEADALLAELLAWASRPEYVYRHHWRLGDMLMWNNTGTMHRATPFDRACGRRLHRTTLRGVESLAAA